MACSGRCWAGAAERRNCEEEALKLRTLVVIGVGAALAACVSAPPAPPTAPTSPPAAVVSPPPQPVPLTPPAEVPSAPVARVPIPETAPTPGPGVPSTPGGLVPPLAFPPNVQYLCVSQAAGKRQETAIEFSPRVAALCRSHPEMGPCQYERDVCRRAGGRVYANNGSEITLATEAEYDRKVLRVRFRAD